MTPDSDHKIKERFSRQLFRLEDSLASLATAAVAFLKPVFLFLSLLYVLFILIHIGFSERNEYLGIDFFQYLLWGLFLSRYLPEFLILKKRKKIRWIVDGGLLVSGLVIAGAMMNGTPADGSTKAWMVDHFLLLNAYAVFLIAAELPHLFRLINSLKIVPSLLFAMSFLAVILIGSVLLMFPNAHVQPVSYLDALFTSVSAVCVTGLTVVDTASAYTGLGKIIIMALIQLGGLGIMTFTGFFGYIFTGSASYKDRLLLRELISSKTMSGLFRMLMQIIGVTFFFEIAGAFLIYLSIDGTGLDKAFFSAFHAISAFCNAGFSTVPDGLASSVLRTNYPMQFIISVLIILGGIGFPVLIVLLRYLSWLIAGLLKKPKVRHRLHGIAVSGRIVLVSTLVLLVFGTLSYYLLERNHLKQLPGFDQLMISFFGSVSSRTAGFNIVDITQWSYPTVLLMIFLMWVGASPASTGGGIKTTTFAVAVKAAYDFIRGRQNVEIGNREIGTDTLTRVLVIILLSLAVIFTGFFVLLNTEPGKDPVHLLFECFSAFGTVGLSMVNTAELSNGGKIVIMIMMFIGRIGPLSLLTGLFISDKRKYYTYPREDLVINS